MVYSGGGVRGDIASYFFSTFYSAFFLAILSFNLKKLRRGSRVGCKGGASTFKRVREKFLNTHLGLGNDEKGVEKDKK